MSNPGVSHSILSFSGRKRWATCPVSVSFGKGIEDEGSPAAAEGTAAHTVAEFYVRQAFDLPGAKSGDAPEMFPPLGLDRDVEPDSRLTELRRRNADWNDELRAAGRAYVDYVRSLIPPGLTHGVDYFVSVELRVAAKSIDDRLFGTLDLTVWFPAWKHAIIVDYKYGFADVPIKDETGALNPQLTAYLVALLDQCTLEAEGATLAVFQPRRVSGAPGQSEKLTKEQIAAERAQLATDVTYVDTTLALLTDDAYANIALCNPGEHCRYCKATKGTCPAMIDGVQTLVEVNAGERSLLDMSDDDVLALFTLRTAIKAFFEDVSAKVELMAKNGHPRITRETKRGRRVFLPNARDTLLALGLEDCLVPGKVEDVASKVPADFHEGIFTRARDSVSLKIVDAPSATQTAKIFAKYSK